jgi:hypothetical protein
MFVICLADSFDRNVIFFYKNTFSMPLRLEEQGRFAGLGRCDNYNEKSFFLERQGKHEV